MKDTATAEDKKEMKTSQQTAQEILDDVAKHNKDMNELDEDQRMVIINDFNSKNKGIAEIVEEKPDQAFIDQAKKDFEDYQNEYVNLKYDVCKKDKALEYAKWLKEWNANHAYAPQNYWIGILKFDEVITDIIKKFEKEPEDFDIDYGALTYLYQMLMGPVSVGLEGARWMAENQETYNAILEKLGEHIDMIELIKKKIGVLQIRWSMACQGFKMNIVAEKLEDFRGQQATQQKTDDGTKENAKQEETKKKEKK
jgi:hypothetical protein